MKPNIHTSFLFSITWNTYGLKFELTTKSFKQSPAACFMKPGIIKTIIVILGEIMTWNLWFLFLSLLFSWSQVVKFSKWKHHSLSKKHCHISLKWWSFHPTSFWMKKGVIWWLLDDNLKGRGQEQEEKGTTNPVPIPS